MPVISPEWSGTELLQPISAERPCGQDLEDTQLLASFDAFRLYGQNTPVDEVEAEGDDRQALTAKKEPPDWPLIKEQALEALRQSKDLRLLAHLGTAALRTDGLRAFLQTVKIASSWVEQYWLEVFPAIDGDGFVRRSALNNFADPMAVIDGLRKTPLVSSREHGAVTLRHLDIAAGQMRPGEKDRPLDPAQITAAFGAVPLEDLAALEQEVSESIQALKGIDAKMRGEIGTEAAPTFDPLLAQLFKADKTLKAQLATRAGAAAAADGETALGEGQPGVAAGPGFSGAIRSRDEAMRALDAVADYFRVHEPSSPVPLFCERARRLVDKPFLDVLADIAPEAVPAARMAGGLRE